MRKRKERKEARGKRQEGRQTKSWAEGQPATGKECGRRITMDVDGRQGCKERVCYWAKLAGWWNADRLKQETGLTAELGKVEKQCGRESARALPIFTLCCCCLSAAGCVPAGCFCEQNAK